MKHIETKKGLETLLKRFENAKQKGISVDAYDEKDYWLNVIKGCLDLNLAMDEVDYDDCSSELQKLWKGLK